MQDRRRIPRVPVWIMLESLRRGAESPAPECRGVIKNLTPDGALLESPFPLDPHDLIHLAFTLPTTRVRLALQARVRWSEPRPGCRVAGLEFQDTATQDWDAIMDYLVTLGPGG